MMGHTVNRRDFIRISAAAGGGLLISITFPNDATPRSSGARAESFSPNAFIQLDGAGDVTIKVGKSEMGQGVMTALPMIVAEEMGADWEKVRVEHAPLGEEFGLQITGGSASVSSSWDMLRQAGATAREMLIVAAAGQWNVDPASCRASNGAVTHASSNRSAAFGDLVDLAAGVPVPSNVLLKNPEDFELIGRSLLRKDTPPKIEGRAVYGIDVKVPGMLYAAIQRSPAFGGHLVSFDDSAARRVTGVRDVVRVDPVELLHPFTNQPGGEGHRHYLPQGIAVVADSTWAAFKGKEALGIEWDDSEAAFENTERIRSRLESLLLEEGKVVRNEGNVETGLQSATNTVESSYELPLLHHATMEPMNCTADVSDGRCKVWAPTQNPRAVATSINAALNIPVESIQVHITHMGGGFGRRLNVDYAVEAALVSKAVGAPVKVTWTREDDIRHGYYRPTSLHRVWAGLNGEGYPTTWKHRVASLSFHTFLSGPGFPGADFFQDDFPANHIPNFRAEFAAAVSEVPRGWWRSVTSSANPFAVESFLDEVAVAGGIDPVDLRLRLLGEDRILPFRLPWAEERFDTGRMKAVIRLAAEKAGWGSALSQGRGRGFASHFFSPTYVAQVAEVSVGDDGTPGVERIVCAVDCGIVVNPNIARAQVKGGILYGLSAALNEQITIGNGRVEQSNFHDYPVLRINETPEVEVHFVQSADAPGGLGEVGVPPVAAAVCNAIFAATGRRIRRLPILI